MWERISAGTSDVSLGPLVLTLRTCSSHPTRIQRLLVQQLHDALPLQPAHRCCRIHGVRLASQDAARRDVGVLQGCHVCLGVLEPQQRVMLQKEWKVATRISCLRRMLVILLRMVVKLLRMPVILLRTLEILIEHEKV